MISSLQKTFRKHWKIFRWYDQGNDGSRNGWSPWLWKSERSDNDDYRNGYKRKKVNSRYGSMEIEVPQDRKSTFEPQVVKKRQKDISDIDQRSFLCMRKAWQPGRYQKQSRIFMVWDIRKLYFRCYGQDSSTDWGLAEPTIGRCISDSVYRCHPLLCTR